MNDIIDPSKIGAVFPYGPIILWERSVQIAISNFCKSGDVVFDIGSNIGGVAIALSRMVGPSGQVYAFECNPRLASWNRANLAVNGAGNVTLVEKAMHSTAGLEVSFYCEDSYFGHGSSLTEKTANSVQVIVPTVSIDSYCIENKLSPSAIKIDVEGAEYDVLCGAAHVLRNIQPVILFEDIGKHPAGRDPLDVLKAYDYTCYDVAKYEKVTRGYYADKPGVSNILCLPPRLAGNHDLVRDFVGTATQNTPYTVEPGLYVFECELTGDSQEQAWLRIVDTKSQEVQTVFETRLNWLRHHASSCLVYEAQHAGAVKIEIGSRTPINGLGIGAIRAYRIENPRDPAYMKRVLMRQYPYAAALVPYYANGTVLLPDSATTGLVTPLPAGTPVAAPSAGTSYSWVEQKFAEGRTRFAQFSGEMHAISTLVDVKGGAAKTATEEADLLSLAAMLKLYRPERFVEIGSGAVADRARDFAARLGLATNTVSMPPGPMQGEADAGHSRARRPFLDLSPIESLQPGDMLAIETDGLVYQGSAIMAAIQHVIPRLPKGGILMINAIYLPQDYPQTFHFRRYNAQSVVAAMLLNWDSADILAPLNFMAMTGLQAGGTNLWLRR